jgi:phosphate transport system permease protein
VEAQPRKRRATARSVLLLDRTAGGGIMAGGISIILAVIGILVFIVLEAYPLFRGAKVREIARTRTESAAPFVIGVNEYRDRAFFVGTRPEVGVFDPLHGTPLGSFRVDGLAGATITAAAASSRGDRLLLGTADGSVEEIGVSCETSYRSDGLLENELRFEAGTVASVGAAVTGLACAGEEGRTAAAVTTADGRLILSIETVTQSLVDEPTRSRSVHDLTSTLPAAPTAVVFTSAAHRLFVGLADGGVQCWSLDEDPPLHVETFQATPSRSVAVSAISVALGDNTVIVGGRDGSLAGWFEVRDTNSGASGKKFRRVHEFPPHAGAVVAIAASARNRGFISADASGEIRIQYLTNERTLARLRLGSNVNALTVAPKSDGFLAALGSGEVVHCNLDNPHPEISLRALFRPIWYEGYDAPANIWQSTGGSDDFEAKLGLVPLLFGTLKGTAYALLFAVPIALFAAIYASQFLHHRIRNVLKPTIEIMAALPSVVLGLVAGLFLAPKLETILPGTVLTLILLPLLFLASALAWRALPTRWTGRFPTGTEVLFLIPIAVLGVWLGESLGPGIERLLFAGDFRHWLTDTRNVRYDQRNCIVVGFAMGFAVIPIIFTICEDALSAVPQHLVSGSIACGASRWQTALRIVLPAAGSGIFSAVMVGFGRAIGETMIVLMATGNTPVMDWSIMNGMRTLSANIAVEIPEAPNGGTLYRVLFFSGFLLFLTTFLINTVAELIRQRLRRKFGNY